MAQKRNILYFEGADLKIKYFHQNLARGELYITLTKAIYKRSL